MPRYLSKEFQTVAFPEQAKAADMLAELQGQRLEVCKIPGRDGEGLVRAVIVPNPGWYSWMCEQRTSVRRKLRKPRTMIRRVDVLRVLERMSGGLPVCSGGIVYELLREAMQREERTGRWD